MSHQRNPLVYKDKSIRKQFLGVDFEVLAIGEKSMVTKMLYKQTDLVPLHRHPNEQNGYVISGKYKLIIDQKEFFLSAGDSYSIPMNVEHSVEIINSGEVIDVFTPLREDYL